MLLVGVLALLFLLVFPWAEPRLPFNNVTVDHPPSSAPSGLRPLAPSGAWAAPRA